MVDYNIGIPQQQYFQAPDLMQNAMRMQQMQTQNAQVDSTNRLRAMQMQGLAQDQQLNALKMQAANQAMRDAAAARAQGVSDRNALTNAIRGSVVGDAGPQMPDLTTAANRLASEGKLGPAATALGAAGAFTAADKSKADLSKINIENLDRELTTFRTFAPTVRTPEDAGLFAASMFDHPRVGKLISQMGLDRDQAIAKAQQDFATDPQRWVASNVGLTAQQAVDVLKQKRVVTERAGSAVEQTEDYFGRGIGAPRVIETAEQAEARRLEGIKSTKRAEADIKKETTDVQTSQQLTNAIKELENAAKPGGLIAKSTGSGLGAATDAAAGFVGIGTSGARAIGQLQPIADIVLKMVPRFEGPQSNADVASYNRAAGQIADPTVPNSVRLDAAKTLIRLMKERKNQFGVRGENETPPQAQTDRAVKRTGVLNGRRVVEYNDGKVEYAD